MNFWQRFSAARGAAIATLIIVYVAFIFELDVLWGLLFVFWSGLNVVQKHTWMTEPILRDETPVLYWIVVATWFLLGITIILYPLIFQYL